MIYVFQYSIEDDEINYISRFRGTYYNSVLYMSDNELFHYRTWKLNKELDSWFAVEVDEETLITNKIMNEVRK